MNVPNDVLLLVGAKAVSLIEEAVEAGLDADGRALAYSTTPFARPLGGLPGVQHTRIKRAIKAGEMSVFTSKTSGKAWLRVPGGYRQFKEVAWARPGGGPVLQASGDMMRALNVTGTKGSSVSVGFTDPDEARKAFWHNVSGVGRSRKRWRWLGLRAEQRAALAAFAAGLPGVTGAVAVEVARAVRAGTGSKAG